MLLTLEEAARDTGRTVRQIRYLIQTGRITARKIKGIWRIERDNLPRSEGSDKAAHTKQKRAIRPLASVLEKTAPRSRGEGASDIAPGSAQRSASEADQRSAGEVDQRSAGEAAQEAARVSVQGSTPRTGDALPPASSRADRNKPARKDSSNPLGISTETLEAAAAIVAGQGRKRFTIRSLHAVDHGLLLYRLVVDRLGPQHRATDHLRESLMLLASGCNAFHPEEKTAFFGRAREQASRAEMFLLLEPQPPDVIISVLEERFLPSLNGLLRRAERRKPR